MTMKKTVLSNMLWRLAERCGAQGVSFIVSLILARILLPEAYGVVSLITVFTSILNLFIDSGFKNALIQKKDADQLDFSTVFYFNIAMGVLLYGMMFAVSPSFTRTVSVFSPSWRWTVTGISSQRLKSFIFGKNTCWASALSFA